MKHSVKYIFLSIFSLIVIFFSFYSALSNAKAKDKELVVYSARAKHLIVPFFNEYEKETGVKINYITDKAPVLRQKLLLEKNRAIADVLLTVDAGNLWKATQDDLLTSIDSPILNKNIPKEFRDPENYWFALTIRARTMVYSPQKVQLKKISSYEDLADKKWKNRLCLRTSKKVYNQSLVAMFIDQYGEKKTEKIVKGWVDNLVTPPYAKDSYVIQAIANGKCEIGLVNSYYLGRLIKKDPSIVEKVQIAWANQGNNDTGTHINISGIGISKYSKKKELAQKFIEWLSSAEIQSRFAALNLEFPVNPKARLDPILQNWGKYQANKTSIKNIGKYQQQAVRLMDRVGYK